MEKHTCKLCSRRFSNGRALGGHMRSHVVGGGAPAARTQISSASSASTSVADDPEEDVDVDVDEDEDEDEDEGRSVHGGLGYVLRENPRKSFRLVDPQFSSSFASATAAAGDAGSCSVVQDRESDSESLPAAAAHHRRRSKRPRSRAPPHPPPPSHDVEPASSVSDATPEEDVARSLMMLSRDSWTNPKSKSETEQSFNHYYCYNYYCMEEEEEGGGGGGGLRQSDGDDCEERARRGASRAVRSRASPKSRSRHQCGTCKKTFRSYQALGGHRASHKKGRVGGGCCFPPPALPPPPPPPTPEPNAGGARNAHACPFCPRVFASAQALGGHKRAHLSSYSSAAAAAAVPPPPPATKLAGSFGAIDLNLPAPADDDFELSAVSDADFGPYN